MPYPGIKVGSRADPYGAYNFHVEIGGMDVGGFMELSGLMVETEVERIREGGRNGYEYILPKGTRYTDIVLKQGLTDRDTLWNWYKSVIKGVIVRQNGTISLLDHAGKTAVMRWDFVDAYPIRWEGPQFNASSNQIAVQTLVLAHHGIIQSR